MQREINELINTTQDITEGTNFIGRQLLGLQASNNPSINAPIQTGAFDGEITMLQLSNSGALGPGVGIEINLNETVGYSNGEIS